MRPRLSVLTLADLERVVAFCRDPRRGMTAALHLPFIFMAA